MSVIALHNCGKSHSQIFKLLKPLKISRMFIYVSIKHYKELWRVEDRAHSGHLKSVGLKLLSKQYGSGFTEIRSGNKIMSRKLNISTRVKRLLQ